MKKIFFVLILFLFWSVNCPLKPQNKQPIYLDEAYAIEDRIEDALSKMTLEEKIAMIHAQSKFSTPGCSRLGIPELWMSDGPHGIRMEISWDKWEHAGWTNDSCTALPALTCLAATFNPELSYKYGKVLGEEARYRKKDILLAPGVNIYRTPLNGRNFEYMGEDPFLASKMVIPYIKGVQENGVAACLKHYALNNQELWRNHIDVEVSNRALHEIYLPAFKAGVLEGKVWAVMGAYNKFRGEYCSHHPYLVNKILKGSWNFDGVMITDWGSAHNTYEAVMNGLDIEMGTFTDGLSSGESLAYDKYYLAQPYLDMIKNGELPESTLDDKVRRVLKLNFRTNMDRSRPYGSFATSSHAEIARQIAEEGIVLLKNENSFFPIKKDQYKKILVIGENANRAFTVGGGSSELKAKKEISPLDGLKAKYGEDNVIFSVGYTSHTGFYNKEKPAQSVIDSLRNQALNLAHNADVILYFGGLNKDYYQDCEGIDRLQYQLPYGQDELISNLISINKNIGIILISGNAVAMPWVNDVQSIMQSWYLGSEAGSATANIISGDVNPSGKLPFTIPKKLEDNGAIHWGKMSYPGDSIKQIYKEDILVGYRWHDTKNIEPLFPFGHGLSYTEFEYKEVTSNKKSYTLNDSIKISLNITNNGDLKGSESIQIYISQSNPSVLRPSKELKAINKVLLEPNETRKVEFIIPVTEIAFYDENKGDWIVESDEYTIHCATSSKDIRSSTKINIINK